MSNATGPQSLSHLLADTPALRRLIADARARAREGQATSLGLPPALAAHTSLQLLPDRLLLIARNNSVAQLLRFHGPRLAREAGVPRFQVKVQPDLFGRDRVDPPRPGPALDQGSAEVIEQLAGALDDDELRSALLRLVEAGKS